mgnify:CR=1 FL=1
MLHKKILLATRPLVPPWDEASKNFAYFLAKNIRDENTEMHILTTPEKLEGLSANVISHALYSAPDKNSKSHYPFFQKARLPLYLFAQSFRYDIVHYLFTPTLFNAFVIRYFTPFRPKTIQTIATLREDRYPKKFLHRLFFADRLITYTDKTKQKLETLGFNNVTRIYPGIDLDRYQPRPKDPAVLATYGLTSNDFFVIYPGEYTRLGATDMLTETFIKYFTEHPDSNMKFLFACRIKNEADRKKREDIRAVVKQAGLESKILFDENSATTDMAALYNTADVVIFPVENLKGKFDVPLIIIEAYACGKPVILSDLPEFLEFANPDICVTISKNQGDKLIGSLAYLSQNEAERTRLGENARRFAKDHFDLKNTAKQYSEVYDSLY